MKIVRRIRILRVRMRVKVNRGWKDGMGGCLFSERGRGRERMSEKGHRGWRCWI